MKTRLKKTKKSHASRTAKAVVCNRTVRRLKRIVTENGKFPYRSAKRCLDVVAHVFGAHRRMCDNLQTVVQKHELGLGGEPVDEIVCAKMEELLGENPAPMADIEARIKARTQPDSEVIEMALCEAGRLMLRPNVLYRFTVRDGCKACADAAAPYSPNGDRTMLGHPQIREGGGDPTPPNNWPAFAALEIISDIQSAGTLHRPAEIAAIIRRNAGMVKGAK